MYLVTLILFCVCYEHLDRKTYPTRTAGTNGLELEQGCLFYMGQIYQVPLPRLSYVHLPSPSQYVLDLVYTECLKLNVLPPVNMSQ